jgi:sarcosine oxidase subunit beta
MSINTTADIVIIGGGVIGASTAYNLAKQGAKNVVLLERAGISSGGTAKSCAIVRTHYSIEANLVHAVESLKIFANFADAVGGACGWHQTGYLILGPDEHRAPMETVFRNQNKYGVDTRILSPEEAREIHPLIQVDDVGVIGYDTLTGYADPYQTATAYAAQAKAAGVSVRPNTPVTGLKLNNGTKKVETPAGNIEAPNRHFGCRSLDQSTRPDGWPGI